jgi:uncharacterized tellurite resistance protein B-like protein
MIMELRDLSYEDKLVSVALLSFIVSADSAGSADEAEHVAEIADAFGDEYDELLDKAQKYHETESEFKALVAKVTDQEARELIYGTVMECASEDGFAHKESEFLSWLADEWSIKVETVDDSDGDQ